MKKLTMRATAMTLTAVQILNKRLLFIDLAQVWCLPGQIVGLWKMFRNGFKRWKRQ